MSGVGHHFRTRSTAGGDGIGSADATQRASQQRSPRTATTGGELIHRWHRRQSRARTPARRPFHPTSPERTPDASGCPSPLPRTTSFHPLRLPLRCPKTQRARQRCRPVPVLALEARTPHGASIVGWPPGRLSHRRSRRRGHLAAPGCLPSFMKTSSMKLVQKGTGGKHFFCVFLCPLYVRRIFKTKILPSHTRTCSTFTIIRGSYGA